MANELDSSIFVEKLLVWWWMYFKHVFIKIWFFSPWFTCIRSSEHWGTESYLTSWAGCSWKGELSSLELAVCPFPADVIPVCKAHRLQIHCVSRIIFTLLEAFFLFIKLWVYDQLLKLHNIFFAAFFYNIATDKVFNPSITSYHFGMTMSV